MGGLFLRTLKWPTLWEKNSLVAYFFGLRIARISIRNITRGGGKKAKRIEQAAHLYYGNLAVWAFLFPAAVGVDPFM